MYKSACVRIARKHPEYYKLFTAMRKIACMVRTADIFKDIDSFIKENLDNRGIPYKDKTDFGAFLKATINTILKGRFDAEDAVSYVLAYLFGNPRKAEKLFNTFYGSSFEGYFSSLIRRTALNYIRDEMRHKRQKDILIPLQEDFTVEEYMDAKTFKGLEYFESVADQVSYYDMMDNFIDFLMNVKNIDGRIIEMLDMLLKGYSKVDISKHFNTKAQNINYWAKKLQEAFKSFVKVEGYPELAQAVKSF